MPTKIEIVTAQTKKDLEFKICCYFNTPHFLNPTVAIHVTENPLMWLAAVSYDEPEPIVEKPKVVREFSLKFDVGEGPESRERIISVLNKLLTDFFQRNADPIRNICYGGVYDPINPGGDEIGSYSLMPKK